MDACCSAAAAASRRAFTLWGSPVTWLEIVAFVLSLAMVVCNMRVNPLGLAAGDRQLAAVLRCCSGTAGSTARRACRSSSSSVAGWGWWQWLRGTRRRRRGAARAPPRRARPLARCSAALALAWPLLGLLPAPLTDTDVPWWDAFPPPAAWSASGCSAASTSRTGRSGWSSTSSASALFAYKGLWLTVLLYALFARAVGGRLARLARSWRARRAMSRGFVIAMLGAESTGKTHAGRASSPRALRASRPARRRGRRVPARVLRPRSGRTPRRDEQAGIAAEQTRRIDAAAAAHDIVVADTTRADDRRLQRARVRRPQPVRRAPCARSARCDLTLLTALDLPWEADGLQRDGPQVREPVDALLRAALARAGIAFASSRAAAPARLASALAAIDRAHAARSERDPSRRASRP